MVFNNRAYYIPNKTTNNTNTKDYSWIENNFTIIVDFKSNGTIDDEATVITRDGQPMGIFLESPNIVKFVWYTDENKYNDIRFTQDDIDQRMSVKVMVSESIEMYVNDTLVGSKPKGNIIDYSGKRLLIGALNPYNNTDQKWFNGEINQIIIYNTLVDYTDKNMYINMDFEENSKFKTFDQSGNGNHGIIIEDPRYVDKSIDTFNNVAPKQKII